MLKSMKKGEKEKCTRVNDMNSKKSYCESIKDDRVLSANCLLSMDNRFYFCEICCNYEFGVNLQNDRAGCMKECRNVVEFIKNK